jgi:hypothetical protein
MYRDDPIEQRQREALAAMRVEREERERIAAREQAERDRSNAEVRRQYLAGLDAKRAEEHARAESAVEEQIAPERARAMREWLANNAGKTERDFMIFAWPHLRLNVIAERQRADAEALKAKLRASGRYQF